MTPAEPFPRPAGDPPPAVQAERTGLAWQRTAIALLVASLVLARLGVLEHGVRALVVPALAVPLCVAVLLLSRRHRAREAGADERPASGPTGALGAALAAATAALCLAELGVLLLG
ncbi:MAG: hypothetical protein CMH83_07700 [Nocardioides sp.]|nr:hypothetical protein [Nocardioides sp.]